MRRYVTVVCGRCDVEMMLELSPDKAEGGFHNCDIDHELRDCGWSFRDDEDRCDECTAQSEEVPHE